MVMPDDSLYFWMYEQGLKQVSLPLIQGAAIAQGRELREKDIQNYWNGWYNSFYRKRDLLDISLPVRTPESYEDLQKHPCIGYPEPTRIWVPCNQDNHPMIKWGKGCLSIYDAMCWPGCVYLAENMYMTRRIVIDIDGDHDKDNLDLDAIEFGSQWIDKTHCIAKTQSVGDLMQDAPINLKCMPVSFHLTFAVDKLVPTMHFPYAHIDIVGNARNSLRYYKTKVYNQLAPLPMTEEIWQELQSYLQRRRNESA